MKQYFGLTKGAEPQEFGPFLERDRAIEALMAWAQQSFKTLPLMNGALLNSRIRVTDGPHSIEAKWLDSNHKKIPE